MVEGIESSYAGRPPAFAASPARKKWAEPKKQKQEALFARGRGMSRVVGGGGADNHRQDECVT